MGPLALIRRLPPSSPRHSYGVYFTLLYFAYVLLFLGPTFSTSSKIYARIANILFTLLLGSRGLLSACLFLRNSEPWTYVPCKSASITDSTAATRRDEGDDVDLSPALNKQLREDVSATLGG